MALRYHGRTQTASESQLGWTSATSRCVYLPSNQKCLAVGFEHFQKAAPGARPSSIESAEQLLRSCYELSVGVVAVEPLLCRFIQNSRAVFQIRPCPSFVEVCSA